MLGHYNGKKKKKKSANKILLNGTERSHQQTRDPADEAQEGLSAQPSLGHQGKCGFLGDGCSRASQTAAVKSRSGAEQRGDD